MRKENLYTYHRMLSAAYYLGSGITSSPYIVLKGMYTYMMPWLMPSVSFEVSKPLPEKEIELIGKPLWTLHQSECTDLILYDSKIAEMIKKQIRKEPPSSTALIPYIAYIPHVSLHIPTLSEVSARALTALIIDLPIFTAKQLYASPIPTVIALYAILPAELWVVLGPQLLRYLPRLLMM